jgi:hypothetical protein
MQSRISPEKGRSINKPEGAVMRARVEGELMTMEVQKRNFKIFPTLCGVHHQCHLVELWSISVCIRISDLLGILVGYLAPRQLPKYSE